MGCGLGYSFPLGLDVVLISDEMPPGLRRAVPSAPGHVCRAADPLKPAAIRSDTRYIWYRIECAFITCDHGTVPPRIRLPPAVPESPKGNTHALDALLLPEQTAAR